MNLYRGRRAVSLQAFTTRNSNRKLSIVMALSMTFTQYAPEITKFLTNYAIHAVRPIIYAPTPIQPSYRSLFCLNSRLIIAQMVLIWS